ncbi:LysR family transcriptional regulator [Gluconobacter cerinus]|uniref:LysR family transcriptional regulator n=1 Tax=Gluconobacter cerinus TaxID=38307 RepID=UPI00193FE545|nr:LysR family transcriptional regulator [Gluconobacter cerinus]MBM3098605.1 LysR family transcriptional regulator [Gluconobacter cerinus]
MFDKTRKSALSDREVFAVFSRTESLAKTADILGTYPSTISRTIRNLETQLNVKLMEKLDGRVFPTQEAIRYGSFIDKKFKEIRSFEFNLSHDILEIDIIATEWLLNNVAIPGIPKNIKENLDIRINLSSSASLNSIKPGKPTIFIGSSRENKKTHDMLLRNISVVNVGIYSPSNCNFINLNKIYTPRDIREIPIIDVVDGNRCSLIKFSGEAFDKLPNALGTVDAFHTAFEEGMTRGCPFVSSDCVVREAMSKNLCAEVKVSPFLDPVYIDVIFSKSENQKFMETARSIHEYGKNLFSHK